jgi:hypothetical protein
VPLGNHPTVPRDSDLESELVLSLRLQQGVRAQCGLGSQPHMADGVSLRDSPLIRYKVAVPGKSWRNHHETSLPGEAEQRRCSGSFVTQEFRESNEASPLA